MGERIGSIPHSGLNILTRKTGKGAEQISVSRPLAQFAKDEFNRATFDPIQATGLRLQVKLKPGYSGGILEWKVQ